VVKQDLIIFLVGTNSHFKGSLPIYALSLALDDFVEQYEEESRTLTDNDYLEIQRLKQNPSLLNQSYLFQKIEPFLLPFYQKNNSTSL